MNDGYPHSFGPGRGQESEQRLVVGRRQHSDDAAAHSQRHGAVRVRLPVCVGRDHPSSAAGGGEVVEVSSVVNQIGSR